MGEEELIDDKKGFINYDLENIKMKRNPEAHRAGEADSNLPDQSEYDEEDENSKIIASREPRKARIYSLKI